MFLSLALTAMAFISVPAHGGSHVQPAEVFTGTDFEPLSAYPLGPVPDGMAGRFILEAGGASQEVIIRRINATRWCIERTLSEPGAPPFRRQYEADLVDGALVSEDGMQLRATEGGVLLLETQDEIVAPDAWTYYARP